MVINWLIVGITVIIKKELIAGRNRPKNVTVGPISHLSDGYVFFDNHEAVTRALTLWSLAENHWSDH